MLDGKNLRFSHQGQEGEYCFTFTAQPGGVTSVSGPSGSGKSTLLDLVAGFLQPRGGTLTLDGLNLLPLPPEKRPVSLLLQAESLFEHLSAEENTALGLPRGLQRSEKRDRIDQALAEVGLSGMGAQQAATLSGGQKQRVALARTLLRDRPVLLLDEPFSALDDETRQTTRTLVRQLTEKHGWHTVLVSHHADDVAALARRRYRLDAGQLRES